MSHGTARYIKDDHPERPYKLLERLHRYIERYDKYVTVFPTDEDRSDGATYAKDINSDGWWIHDKLKRTKEFDDWSHCSNWKASMILHDILKEEGYWFRSKSWFVATLVFGEFTKIL